MVVLDRVKVALTAFAANATLTRSPRAHLQAFAAASHTSEAEALIDGSVFSSNVWMELTLILRECFAAM
jgi:hypothetical protein